jgi:hypothetical protein
MRESMDPPLQLTSQFQAQLPIQPLLPTSTPSSSKKRVGKLTAKEHLILLRHVCEHQGEYQNGKIAFQKKISQLFEEDTGYNLLFEAINIYIY